MGLLSPKLGVKTMAHFCRALAQTGRGSVQIDRSLALLMGPSAPVALRRVLPPVLDHIKSGGTLADAFRLQRRYIPADFLELVAAAESGGRVEPAFEYLAHDYEVRLEFYRSMVQQMTYPLMVWISAAYIIPYFRDLMLTHDSPEAYTLKFILGVVVSWLPTLIVFMTLRQLGLVEKLFYGIASRTWPWQGILHNIALVRFFRCLAMLLEAGLTVPGAIERSAAVTVNPRVFKSLRRAVPLVQGGASLTEALRATGMLPDLAVEMVRTGEFAGRLEDLLRKTAHYIEESTSHYVKMLQFTFIGLLIPAILLTLVLQGLAAQVVMVFMAMRKMLGG